jgi:hypothetical protein
MQRRGELLRAIVEWTCVLDIATQHMIRGLHAQSVAIALMNPTTGEKNVPWSTLALPA